jgi:hypothetical protein
MPSVCGGSSRQRCQQRPREGSNMRCRQARRGLWAWAWFGIRRASWRGQCPTAHRVERDKKSSAGTSFCSRRLMMMAQRPHGEECGSRTAWTHDPPLEIPSQHLACMLYQRSFKARAVHSKLWLAYRVRDLLSAAAQIVHKGHPYAGSGSFSQKPVAGVPGVGTVLQRAGRQCVQPCRHAPLVRSHAGASRVCSGCYGRGVGTKKTIK